MILFGVVLKSNIRTRLYVDSLINPGSEYEITNDVKAYLLVLEKDDFFGLTQEKLDIIYRDQVADYLKSTEVSKVDIDQLFNKVNELQHRNDQFDSQRVMLTDRKLLTEEDDIDHGIQAKDIQLETNQKM